MQAQLDTEDEYQSAEFVKRILTLYPARFSRQDRATSSLPFDSMRVISLVKDARDNFERRRDAGDDVAAAVLELTTSACHESDIAAVVLEQRLEGAAIGGAAAAGRDDADLQRLASVLYHLAEIDIERGYVERGAVLLAVLLHLRREVTDAMAGLAVCGVRLGKFDEALILANECLKLPIKHPRAFFVAGLCELKRGNRKSAQSLLATAARFARKQPEFRADLHAAQRLLLILHYG